MVLGDDVIIAREQVARTYVRILTEIGVRVSSSKTVSPRGDYHGAEFASRLFRKGSEISPLPLGTLLIEKEGEILSLFTF